MSLHRPRMRNYRRMTDEKLKRVMYELEEGGEAYERSLDIGSRNPDADLDKVYDEAAKRGLIVRDDRNV